MPRKRTLAYVVASVEKGHKATSGRAIAAHLPFGGGSGSLTIARQASLKTFPLRPMARLTVSPWRAIGSRTFALRECYAMMVCGPGCARPGLRVRDRGRK